MRCIGACVVALSLAGCSPSTAGPQTTPPVAPTIIAQPSSLTAFVGDTATFSVTASGSPSPSYQWSKGSVAIPGATSNSYTTPALAPSDSGTTYTVTVANSAGTVTSVPATLTVNPKAVSILANPTDVTVTAGVPATFTVTASGTGPLAYQWFRNGVAVPGATSASYTISGTQLSDSGATFSVAVSNTVGAVASGSAKLTVNPNPIAITVQPKTATQFVGETATYSVTASGTTPSYQWRKNGVAIPGATTSSYTTPTITSADDNTSFDVVVSNSAGAVTSSAALLRVGPFPTTYTTQKGAVLSLYAWPGTKNAVLTKTSSLDPAVMRRIVNVADGTYNYYAAAVGKTPSLYFNYNGLATIAETGVGGVDLCGAGCTYLGATGMELADDAFDTLYKYAQVDEWDQVMFYEFGRSFWLFGSQLTHPTTPNYSSCITTGYAVLMRYRSIQAQNLIGLWNNTPQGYTQLYTDTLGLIDQYATTTSLNFANTFNTGTFAGTGGLGCTDLFASLVLRLAQNNGDEAFIDKLWREALKRPVATSAQDAYDNLFLAASAASDKNLATTFASTWKWPLSAAAVQEAQSKWGNPQ